MKASEEFRIALTELDLMIRTRLGEESIKSVINKWAKKHFEVFGSDIHISEMYESELDYEEHSKRRSIQAMANTVSEHCLYEEQRDLPEPIKGKRIQLTLMAFRNRGKDEK